VLDQTFGLEGTGGVVRLWDPRTLLDVDLVGWGAAKTYSNALAQSGYAAAVAVPSGKSLQRKANQSSTFVTMEPGGKDALAGNDFDSDDDKSNWLVASPDPQSRASGVYEPACQNTCSAGLTCTYVPGKEKCVDAACGGQCGTIEGAGCNAVAQTCDAYVLLAEIAAQGPKSVDQKGGEVQEVQNAYIVLYNPSAAAVKLDGLALRYKKTKTDTVFTKLTATTTGGTSASKLLSGFIEPFGYYLIAQAKLDPVGKTPLYDKNLPVPDHVHYESWAMSASQGFVQLVRINGTYEGGSNEADKVAWGAVMADLGEGKTAAAPQSGGAGAPGSKGAMRRLPAGGVSGKQVGDPLSGWFYAGAGRDTNNNAADWVTIALRQPRNAKSPAQKP